MFCRFPTRKDKYVKSSKRLISGLENFTNTEKLQNKIFNVPLLFVNEKLKGQWKRKNQTCGRLPNVLDLKFNNKFWQKFQTSTLTSYILNAFYENRTQAGGPHVRFLGMIYKPLGNLNIYCQLWFDDELEPVVSGDVKYKYLWDPGWGNYKDGILQPYLITFKIPASHTAKIPKMVSLVENPCQHASNSLRVIHNKPKEESKKFAVCVKGLTFPDVDLSLRIVEWIEVITALGADKIYVYDLNLHSNITKVIRKDTICCSCFYRF